MKNNPQHSLCGMDESHALYGSYIGVQFIFADQLDADILTQAIAELAASFPALGGKADFENSRVNMARAYVPKLEIISNAPGQATDHAGIGAPQENRYAFVSEPRRRDVFAGRAILSTFRLTQFSKGGCILGMGISHALVDGAGFHMLAGYLCECYAAFARGKPAPAASFSPQPSALNFGAWRDKRAVKAQIKQDDIPMPIPVKGLMGGLWSRLIMSVMERNRKTPRAVCYLSADQVSQLKASVLAESGEDWISTNVALGAHFACIMAQLQFGGKAKAKMQIGQVLDIRSRYFEDVDGGQSRYPGNVILIYTDKGEFPGGFQNTPRGDIAHFMKASLARLNAPFVKQRLDLIEDALQCGWTYPGLDVRSPMIAVNNQSKMDVYAADFGQNLLRVIPQDVGDHIMIFPAKDGGVEVYLRDLVRPGGQLRLYDAAWRKKIYAL